MLSLLRRLRRRTGRPIDAREKLRVGVWSRRVPLVGATAFLVTVFLLGGGSRGDIWSLIVLRPLAALILGYALIVMSPDEFRTYRPLFMFAAVISAVVALYLVPLPPGLLAHLPGRDFIAAVGSLTAESHWSPLAAVPEGAWNALFALLVPLAMLVLSARLRAEGLQVLMLVIVGVALASACLGLLQLVGSERGALYFYRISNFGTPVGLFSNRNHHAVFLAAATPLTTALLLAYGRVGPALPRIRITGYFTVIAVLAIAALIIGSRAGLLAMGLALLGSAAIYVRHRVRIDTASRRIVERGALAAGALIVASGVIMAFYGRGESLHRLSAETSGEDLRARAWPTVAGLVRDYFPFGSGPGSFDEAFRRAEPTALLSPSYFNHAHNDWLEVLATLGMPGVILLAVAIWGWTRVSRRAWRAPISANSAFATAASMVIAVLALGSFVDYPLRTPSLSTLVTLAAVWLVAFGRSAPAVRSSKPGENLSPGGTEVLPTQGRLT